MKFLLTPLFLVFSLISFAQDTPPLVDKADVPEDTVTIDGEGGNSGGVPCLEQERFPNCDFKASDCKKNCEHAYEHNKNECNKKPNAFARWKCNLPLKGMKDACITGCPKS